MYAFFEGEIAEVSADRIALLVGGIGYEIFLPIPALAKAVPGDQKRYYTFFNVKENEMTLYGFESIQEKSIFLKLISVSGVGPRMALAALGTYTPEQIAAYISSGDDKAFAQISGVGKKIAQRIILELKDKMGDLGISAASDSTTNVSSQSTIQDAIAVLEAMGFRYSDAQAAVALVQADGGSAEDIALRALRALDRG